MLGEEEGARAVGAAAALRRRCSALDLPIILLVGGATGTGKSTRRDRGRAPARDHARHVDRLHPPDDARVLLRGVHAVDPLLELRGGRRRSTPRTGDPTMVGFLEQTRNVLVGVEARDRARAHRGLVDGARGRPPRARDGARRARGRARRPRASLAIESEDVHRDALPRPRRDDGRRARDGQVPRRGSTTSGGSRLHRRAARERDRRPGDRERERRPRDRRADGARAALGRAAEVPSARCDAERGRDATAQPCICETLRARDRARGARRRALARPGRPGGGRGGRVLGRALRARVAADQRPDRDRRARGRRPARGRRRDRRGRRGGRPRARPARGPRRRRARRQRTRSR